MAYRRIMTYLNSSSSSSSASLSRVKGLGSSPPWYNLETSPETRLKVESFSYVWIGGPAPFLWATK